MDWLIHHTLADRLGMDRLASVFLWTVIAAFALNVCLAFRIVWTKGARPTSALAAALHADARCRCRSRGQAHPRTHHGSGLPA